MAAAFVSLHVAAYAERLSTPGLRTLVWLLTGVAVTVNTQTARSREGFVARRADVAVW